MWYGGNRKAHSLCLGRALNLILGYGLPVELEKSNDELLVQI